MNDKIKVYVLDRGRTNLYMRYLDPLTGKHVERSTGTRKKREAERIAAKWEAELQEGRYKSPLKVTWEEFRERYEMDGVAGLAEKTLDQIGIVFNSVETVAPVQRLIDLNTNQIIVWQNGLRNRGLAESTIKSYTAHLKASIRWARDVGMIHELPKISMPKRAKQAKAMKGRPITAEEFERMLAKIPDVLGKKYVADWEHFLRGLWWSGLRLGEALRLTWDGDNLRVEIMDGEPCLHIPADSHKSNRLELLPVAPEFAEMLLTVPTDDRTGFVFRTRTRRGESRRVDNVSTTICRFGKAAGVKVDTSRRAGKEHTKFASAHDLRRAFGTRWAARIMPMDLMILMRHDDIKTTQRYYVQADVTSLMGRLRQAVSRDMNESRSSVEAPQNVPACE